jgi:ketosteroid isomerase-like protein
MHPNASLIEAFYAAFQRRDSTAMGACYTPAARFHDPVFTLEGWHVRAMWRMLCERGKDLRIECRDVQADGASGSAHWEAWYTFTATGRPVHNSIDASFTFEGGRIRAHDDRFSLYRWARQALGPRGILLGWAPPVQGAIRRQAAAALEAYIRSHGLTETTV